MNKITPEHLARGAYVYIRQSTADQLLHNHESRRRQYGLSERARQLGWSDATIIDDDLGRSGAGIARPGFERLLAAICEGRVGAVLAIEASRLARNGRDWHTLIEFCGLVGTLIIDEDGVYEPRHPNDRLLLGMKGTMSELELSLLRQRSLEALRQKARRGELFLTVAIGYVKIRHDRIQKDPDQRVQEAIGLVFGKFAEFQSIRQVHLWLRQELILLPAVDYHVDQDRRIVWKPPVYNTVHHILTNPIYAGAYVFGRTGSRVSLENGRKRVVRGFKKERSTWEVLIVEHHEGYLSWAEFERNQRLIADNATGKGMMIRGAVRRGETLLAGLLRCGHCGRKLHVAYSGTKGDVGRYHCRGAMINHGTGPCISFGSLRVDHAVGTEVLRLLQPLGIEAAIKAIEARDAETDEKGRQTELALKQARYEATHARRQYDAVDPDNRLVAATLEGRWNDALFVVRKLEDQLEAIKNQCRSPMNAEERDQLMRLGADLERAWQHPAATASTRKQILRTVLSEIVARVDEGQIRLVLHWQGGDHTELAVMKSKTGQHRWTVDTETDALIRELARLMPDKAIAAILNRAGRSTGRENGWTQSRVCTFRNHRGIAVYRDGERLDRGELTLGEAAIKLNVSPMTVLRLIRDGVIPATQFCRGAPWVIKEEILDRSEVKRAAIGRRKRPLSQDPGQISLAL
ncbi:recombinase family protein [Acidiphilium iwatense]|uniref:Recombinase family protein n=1 Tax=Acidiphilium iwatense TaxID=768198 RepID=A0ABS9E1N1_9PROT|nr:recombinase family protein [Acidiphilium iwatense]MCF3948921.1 recombinase family protein [Acidiphilium iwatense]